MESRKLVAINERLNKLRFSLGVDWGELAKLLDISRSMLGFVRSEVKPASPKLMHRIVELEKRSGSHSVATCKNCEILLNRVIELEAQLLDANHMYDKKTKAMVKLIKAFEEFKKEFVSPIDSEDGTALDDELVKSKQ